jgi:hypothetical protein
MPFVNLNTIQQLMDQVEAASQTPEAARRRALTRPTTHFNIESPLAEVRMFGWNITRLFSDPAYYVECILRRKLWRWEQFPDDEEAISMDLDAWLSYYPEYSFLGMDVTFDALGIPIINSDTPLKTDPDVRHLKPVDFHTTGWMPRIFRWYDDLREIAGGRMRVNWGMNWWRGCLDLAIELRGFDQFIDDTSQRPQFVEDLMKFIVEQRCRWWEGYYQHFGLPKKPTDIGDDWINVPFISPRIFARFVLPRYLELEAFHGGINSIHSCGNQTPVQRYLLELKSLNNFEISPWTDMEQTVRNLPPDKHLMVGLHPNDVMAATPQEMQAKLEKIAATLQGWNYDIGTSGLTPLTPGLEDMVRQIRAWTRLARQIFEPIRNSRLQSSSD